MFKDMRKLAFIPPCILLVVAISLNFINENAFVSIFTTLNSFFIEKLGWLCSLVTLACFILLLVCVFSKFGDVVIGGKSAKPRLSLFNWFAITVTSTLAGGSLIWGTAEPIYYLMDPASALTGFEPMSGDAAKFAMETLFLHWSVLPYAIYTVPAVLFAFMYYNAKSRYSVSSQFEPLLGKYNNRIVSACIDGLLLFCVAISMASSFGQALLSMTGGMRALFGLESSAFLLLCFTVVIAIISIITAITGVDKGIKVVARINMYGYIIVLTAFLVFGGATYIFSLATESLGGFLSNFFERALFTGAAAENSWPQSWTTFYYASWMGWAPITGIFLAFIAYGRKIKQLIFMSMGCTAVASIVWMSIIGGTTINIQMSGKKDLVEPLQTLDIGVMPYEVMGTFPASELFIALYFVVIVLTLITAVNSNLVAISGLSSKKASNAEGGKDESPWVYKVIWGAIISTIACIMMIALGSQGVKALVNVSGIIALFILIAGLISLVLLILKFKKYDKVDLNEDKGKL